MKKISTIRIFIYAIFILYLNVTIKSQESDTIRIDELTFTLPDVEWDNINTSRGYAQYVLNHSFLLNTTKTTELVIVKDSLKENFENLLNLELKIVIDSIFNNEVNLYKNYKHPYIRYNVFYSKKTEIYGYGKKFYVLNIKSKSNTVPATITQEILYWYFPEDYFQRHVSYGFRIVEYWYDGEIGDSDFEYLDFVLKNFKINKK